MLALYRNGGSLCKKGIRQKGRKDSTDVPRVIGQSSG